MEIDMPLDEGFSGEDDKEEEDDDGKDDDEAERLLRWRMVEGEKDIPSGSPLPHDTTTDQRVEDLHRILDESTT